MKLKNYIFTIVFIVFLHIIVLIGLFRYNNNERILLNDIENQVVICKDYQLNQSFPNESYKTMCDKYLERDYKSIYKRDFSHFVGTLDNFMPLNLESAVIIYCIVILSAYPICRYLRSGIIKYDIERQNFKDIKKKIILPSLFAGLIPLIMLIFIILIGLIYTGNFSINAYLGFQAVNINKPILLCISSILIPLALGLYYSNVTLIVSRKKHNFIISSILSFLIIIGIEIFFETIFSSFLGLIFNDSVGIAFNSISYYHYADYYGLFLPTIFSLSLLVVSTIIMIKSYKSKEKIVMDCEI